MIVQEGWKWFLAKSIAANAEFLRVALLREDFDEMDTTLQLADLFVADYPGYANQIYELESSTPDITDDPFGRLVSVTFTWTPVDIIEPQTIYGVCLYVDATLELICVNRFVVPIEVSEDTHVIERGIDFYDQSFVL